jgi:hypothetical protein
MCNRKSLTCLKKIYVLYSAFIVYRPGGWTQKVDQRMLGLLSTPGIASEHDKIIEPRQRRSRT